MSSCDRAFYSFYIRRDKDGLSANGRLPPPCRLRNDRRHRGAGTDEYCRGHRFGASDGTAASLHVGGREFSYGISDRGGGDSGLSEEGALGKSQSVRLVIECGVSKYIIANGDKPAALKGKVKVQGSKNGALPLIAAAALTDREVVLNNCPDILDVENMLRIYSAKKSCSLFLSRWKKTGETSQTKSKI